MTHDEMIAVIQAHKDGKVIEYTPDGIDEWYDCGNSHLFDFCNNEYRIKREPRRCYRNEYASYIGRACFDTREEAIRESTKDFVRVVEFVEVLK